MDRTNDEYSKNKLEKVSSLSSPNTISSSTELAEATKYEPQGPQLEPLKIVEMKPVKQNVTYDSSTGKMYEELGSSSGASAQSNQQTRSNYFQSYQSTYPYSGMQSAQYMGSYTGVGYTTPSPYDRYVGTAIKLL